MDQRVFHGNLTPEDVSRALYARFNRGNLRVQQVGQGEKLITQISSAQMARSGGQTALTVTLQKAPDGLLVQVGNQAMLGVAASLGMTALAALQNPLNLLGRLDDVAQDIESLQLIQEVWQTIEAAAQASGATFELSERLRRMVCEYCGVANQVGSASCIACGAPLGDVQPTTCRQCGFVLRNNEAICPNCHNKTY